MKSLFVENEHQFRQHAAQRIWRMVSLLMVLFAPNSAAFAVSPRDDFAKWYVEWLENLPTTYEVAHTDVFNLKPNEKPWMMKTSKWVQQPYRLITISNSRVNKDFRFLENLDYCATIESVHSAAPIWSIKDFVPGNSWQYDELSSKITDHFGARLELGFRAQIFDRPHQQVLVSESGKQGHRIAEIQFSFEKQASAKARDLLQMTAFLDESIGWMPKEIRKVEIEGIKSRFAFSGWHQIGDMWVLRDLTCFIQMPSDKEVVHNKEVWNFLPAYRTADRQAECFLTYYGLHEPRGPSTISVNVLLFLVAFVLFVVGYWIWKRRGEAVL